MAAKSILEKWIAEALNDPEHDKPCTAIQLLHMVGGGTDGKELHTVKIKIPGGQYEPDKMAKMFRGKAEAYSHDLPGVQTFQLVAYYGGSSEPSNYQPFIVNMRVGNFTSGLSTEAPDGRGETQQRMRQGEMMFQQVYRRQEQMDNRSDRLIDILSNANGRLQRENMEMFSGIKELIMAKVETDRAHELKLAEHRRGTVMREGLLKMAPPLANTVFGKEIFPQATVDTAIIEALIEKAPPEMVQMLMAMLPEEMQAIIATRLKASMDAKAAAEQHKARLPPFRGTVEQELGMGGNDDSE